MVSLSLGPPSQSVTVDTFASFWVGLDGDGTNSVEQTGTEADCTGGAAAYQGWFETFPQAPVFYDNPVQPGDAMSASVVANGGGAFTRWPAAAPSPSPGTAAVPPPPPRRPAWAPGRARTTGTATATGPAADR